MADKRALLLYSVQNTLDCDNKKSGNSCIWKAILTLLLFCFSMELLIIKWADYGNLIDDNRIHQLSSRQDLGVIQYIITLARGI